MAWNPLETRFLDEEVTYDGTQIAGQWAYRTLGVLGDSMVAFVGPCRVALSEMVDLADVRAGDSIRAASMLHFVAEHFDRDLERAVLRQRLFTALVCDEINRAVPGALRREGDDLYAPDGRKASVSIAAPTPVSAKIHFALNLDPAGAPVPAVGIAELGLEARPLGERLLALYEEELTGVYGARCKVRSAGG